MAVPPFKIGSAKDKKANLTGFACGPQGPVEPEQLSARGQ